jgi:hypothetical protein
MQLRRTCCSVAALLTAALLYTGAARAAQASTSRSDASQVTVVDPPAGDRVLTEAGSRIRSELDAAGLSHRSAATAATCGAGEVDSDGCSESASAAAAIALSREDGLATIRVVATLPDGYELRRDVRVPPEAGGDDPAVLAVRAVELLRDIYLDVPRAVAPRQEPAPPRAEEPAAVAVAPAPPPAQPVREVRASFAAVVLVGRKGLGPAVAPGLEMGMTLGHGLTAIAAAAGPFAANIGDDVVGRARTTQAMMTVGLRYDVGESMFRPYLSLVGGVHYIKAQGLPQSMGEIAVDGSGLSALFGAGGGLSARFFPWLALEAGVAALSALPPTNVAVHGHVVGQAGAPSILGQLALSITFANL